MAGSKTRDVEGVLEYAFHSPKTESSAAGAKIIRMDRISYKNDINPVLPRTWDHLYEIYSAKYKPVNDGTISIFSKSKDHRRHC